MMATDRRLDERISRWLEAEAPGRLPDRVLRATFERTRRTRQQGGWHVLLGRIHMPRPVLALGSAAIVVIVAAVALSFIGNRTGVGGPAAPSPSPTPTPEPTRTPATGLPEGPFLVEDVAAPADTPFITITIPAPGWTSIPDFGGLIKGPDEDPPQSAMLFWSWPAGTAFDVYGDPCQWKSTRPDTPATTVDEIAAALATQGSRDASDPVDVTVAGYSGKKIALHVPNNAPTRAEAFAECDDDTFASYGVAGASTPNRYQQGPGQVDELWILNVNQAFVIIDVMYRPDTPAALIEEMRTIAESATFAW